MTARERILSALTQARGRVCDDCLARVAELSARQVAFSTCTELARKQVIEREKGLCALCSGHKNVNWARDQAPPAVVQPAAPAPVETAGGRPWYWEGHVQSQLVTWLALQGYKIKAVADTAARTQGKDVVAMGPDERDLWVSVKGYPENSAQTQARHWFAGAVFDLVLYRQENTAVSLALGLPNTFTTYASLAQRSMWLRQAMPFTIYWVGPDGGVRVE